MEGENPPPMGSGGPGGPRPPHHMNGTHSPLFPKFTGTRPPFPTGMPPRDFTGTRQPRPPRFTGTGTRPPATPQLDSNLEGRALEGDATEMESGAIQVRSAIFSTALVIISTLMLQ